MSEPQQTLTIQNALDLPVQHHTAGRFPEAERIYREVLKSKPDQPVALHLLGVIAHQVGKNDQAVELITKAINIKPDFAEAYNHLGMALLNSGQYKGALEIMRKRKGVIEFRNDNSGKFSIRT